MLYNQKILSFGGHAMQKPPWALLCPILGAARLPIAALIRPLVNFDVGACAGDSIMKEETPPDENMSSLLERESADMIVRAPSEKTIPKAPLVCIAKLRDPSAKSTQVFSPSYLVDIMAW